MTENYDQSTSSAGVSNYGTAKGFTENSCNSDKTGEQSDEQAGCDVMQFNATTPNKPPETEFITHPTGKMQTATVRCTVHPEKEALAYCSECDVRQLACLQCIVGEHSGHDLKTSLEDGLQRQAIHYGNAIDTVYRMIQTALDSNSHKVDSEQLMLEKVLNLSDELNSHIDSIEHDLQQVRTTLQTVVLEAAHAARRKALNVTNFAELVCAVKLAGKLVQKSKLVLDTTDLSQLPRLIAECADLKQSAEKVRRAQKNGQPVNTENEDFEAVRSTYHDMLDEVSTRIRNLPQQQAAKRSKPSTAEAVVISTENETPLCHDAVQSGTISSTLAGSSQRKNCETEKKRKVCSMCPAELGQIMSTFMRLPCKHHVCRRCFCRLTNGSVNSSVCCQVCQQADKSYSFEVMTPSKKLRYSFKIKQRKCTNDKGTYLEVQFYSGIHHDPSGTLDSFSWITCFDVTQQADTMQLIDALYDNKVFLASNNQYWNGNFKYSGSLDKTVDPATLECSTGTCSDKRLFTDLRTHVILPCQHRVCIDCFLSYHCRGAIECTISKCCSLQNLPVAHATTMRSNCRAVISTTEDFPDHYELTLTLRSQATKQNNMNYPAATWIWVTFFSSAKKKKFYEVLDDFVDGKLFKNYCMDGKTWYMWNGVLE